jgi:hypothetical protein
MNLYIDIAISMVLIFLIFSVVVYVLQELVAINLQYRGKMLWNSLASVFDGVEIPGSRFKIGWLVTEAKKEVAAVKGAIGGAIAGKAPVIPGSNMPVTQLFFNHAQIRTLQKNANTLTSYISSSNFSLALIDVVAQQAPAPRSGNLFIDFKAGLPVFSEKFAKLPDGKTPRPVVDLLNTFSGISGDITQLQAAVEKWFNEYMNRVSGWYQSHTVVTIRLLAIAVTLAFNLNCIQLVKDIAGDSVLRTNLTGIAERVVDHPESIDRFLNQGFNDQVATIQNRYQPLITAAGDNTARVDSLRYVMDTAKANAAARYTKLNGQAIDSLTKTLSAVSLPIGWGRHAGEMGSHRAGETGSHQAGETQGSKGFWECVPDYLLTLLGWLIMAGCLSMGAPFWFNLLIQLVNIRRAGVKPGGDKKK